MAKLLDEDAFAFVFVSNSSSWLMDWLVAGWSFAKEMGYQPHQLKKFRLQLESVGYYRVREHYDRAEAD